MIFHLSDRRGLLDFLSSRDQGTRVTVGKARSPHELITALQSTGKDDALLLVWDSEAGLDSFFETFVIVVADEGYDEFLAWTHTYIGEYKPFTSFFRVIRGSDIERFDVFNIPQPWLPRKVLDALAAVSIAEAVLQIGARGRGPSVQNCVLTFSFAALKGLYSGLHPAQIVDLAERWDGIRQLGGSAPRLSANDALSFWLIATSAFLPGPESDRGDDWMALLEALVRNTLMDTRSLAKTGAWTKFPDIGASINAFDEASGLPREQQIRVMDRATDSIKSSSAPRPLKDAILGWLVAKLGDGSMEYLQLTLEFGEEYTCAPLWFAFFCGFQNNFDGMTYRNALGRHLVRRAAVRRSAFDKSNVFMSYDEMNLVSGAKNIDYIQNTFGSIFEVELLPSVSVPVPNPFRRSEEEGSRRTESVDQVRVSRLLREALFLLDRPERQDRSPSKPRSDDLFQNTPPKPRLGGKRRKTT